MAPASVERIKIIRNLGSPYKPKKMTHINNVKEGNQFYYFIMLSTVLTTCLYCLSWNVDRIRIVSTSPFSTAMDTHMYERAVD